MNPIYVNLDAPCTAAQLKLKALSANNGSGFGGGAEFDLHEEKAPEIKNDREFLASELTLAGEPTVDGTGCMRCCTGKEGKAIR